MYQFEKLEIHQATIGQEEIVFAMAQAFHLEDGHPLAASSGGALRGAIEGSAFAKVYLVESGNVVLGYFVLCFTLSIEFGGLVVILDDFFLKPEFRGKNIGTHVMQEIKNMAADCGAVQVFLEVELANERARKFYEANGFQVRERRMMEFFPQK